MKISTAIGTITTLACLVLAGAVYYQSTAEAKTNTEIETASTDYQNLILLQPVEPIKENRHTPADIQCLALNIYFEARNESNLAQQAVAWVTVNRAYHRDYPDTLCDVVWDEQQFSWTHDGRSDRPTDQIAWQHAQTIAAEIIQTYPNTVDPTEGSLMYHADYSKPYWRTSYDRVVQIDSHIFYREK